MLIWTATTRSAVESRANAIIENHSVITDIINEEVMKCDQNPNQKTSWGENCSLKWTANKIVEYLLNNVELKNPYSIEGNIIQAVSDPRIEAEGKAGQSTNKGIIFVSDIDFSAEPGSEWIIGTCIKSPCVAAGNNELVSIYR